MSFVSTLGQRMDRYSFSHYGWAALERPLSMDVYENWLKAGFHAGMSFLADSAGNKANPRGYYTKARSAIVVAKPYLPHPFGERVLPRTRTALYAQGEDYHSRFKAELQAVADGLKMDFPGEEFLCCTDTAPVLERDLAYRAGLGWVGKNTCLIHPKHGSLFFLGQILTSMEVSEEQAATPVADACGTCDRCIRACPTGALEAPRWLNAGKCISYLTIEAREDASEELRAKIGDWFFGCDICQTVCPWNEKKHGKELLARLSTGGGSEDDSALEEDLRWILNTTHHQMRKALAKSPLARARPLGLKRNALVVIGNRRLRNLKDEAERAARNPGLKDVAQWALAQLS